MSVFTRRRFLAACGVGALGLAGFACTAPNADAFQAHISRNFTAQESQLVQSALQLVGRHLASPAVRQSAYRMGWRTHIDPGYAQAIGLPADNEWHRMCMWHQIESYLARFMPAVTIRPMAQPSEHWGQAQTGLVRTLNITQRTGQIDGQFVLELNRGRMFRDAQGSDPARWANIIVHEMMHNLGHNHGVGDYNTHWQMNALQASFFQACLQEGRRVSVERAAQEFGAFAQEHRICSHCA